ncbi:hypothetical protein GCK72_010616 [Caenorhabditis remanei]|uniref:Uncharacterized protein n=1 Tax=Caenorhabditis remanei TaxID=31234 RepID=A0A6A5H6G5_CAERE|nr:hypothetical protein GCK72_010616 [Caenorhabditis remanei]KAF1762354.1 hypothetical protein GCK72_010616 [Caenorhabditis remanei]
MLPGSKKPLVLPDGYVPPTSQYVDTNLASYLATKFGSLDHLSINKIRNINLHLLDMNIPQIWNGCNGYNVDLISELSLDATPRNHSFVNMIIRVGNRGKRNYVSVLKYFQEKYNITLNYPHSPLLRDSSGRMYPLEAIWFRMRVY